MEYLKINGKDFSEYVNELKVGKRSNYNAQTNAAGNTVVDYINKKYTVEVGFIPLDGAEMLALQQEIDAFNVSLSFRNPLTNEIVENVNCIIPESNVEYYTIQVDKVMYKAFTLTFTEL